MKALEKDRNRRYETASGFAADIERYLHDEPVEACPPSAALPLPQICAKRNKAALAIAGMVLSFIVLLGGGVGWALRDRAARQEETAQQASESLTRARMWIGESKLSWPARSWPRPRGGLGATAPRREVCPNRSGHWKANWKSSSASCT